MWEHYLVSARRVCGLLVLAESSYRYVSERNDEPRREKSRAGAIGDCRLCWITRESM